jgi:glucose-6-phosphate isomerase
MATLEYKNLDQCKAYMKLKTDFKACDLKKILTADRVASCQTAAGAGLTYNYAAKPVDDKTLDLLQELADEQQCLEKYRAIYEGEVMNTGEKRLVLHHLVRSRLGADVVRRGKNSKRSCRSASADRTSDRARCIWP